MVLARPRLAAVLMSLAIAPVFTVSDASAQQIYKIVGPDGRVTFSDKPPLDANAQAAASAVSLSAAAGSSLASLPFEVRQAASRYPVTLYTSPGCVTCAEGRTMLVARGIPFSEKTVASNEDIEALKRFAGATAVPLLTIGSQQIKGFSEPEWTQFLDAAGYPKTSQLPPSYVPSPATPLVAVDDSARTGARQAQSAAAAPAAPATGRSRRARAAAEAATAEPPNENPAGIQF